MRSIPFQPLDPALYREIVRRALAEDLGWGDVTTEAIVPAGQRARGIVLAKSPCVLAGLEVAGEVFLQLDPGCAFERRRKDSDACAPGDVVAEVSGQAGADAHRRAHGAQSPAAALRHRDHDAPLRRRRRRPHRRARHAQDDSRAARAREICRPRRRRHEPPKWPGRRHPDQGQPRAPGRRRAGSRPADEGRRSGNADRGRSAVSRAGGRSDRGRASTSFSSTISRPTRSGRPSGGRAAARRSRFPAASRWTACPSSPTPAPTTCRSAR